MQKKNFEILVQTALTVGLFWKILKLTPKSALLSFTILYFHLTIINHTLNEVLIEIASTIYYSKRPSDCSKNIF